MSDNPRQSHRRRALLAGALFVLALVVVAAEATHCNPRPVRSTTDRPLQKARQHLERGYTLEAAGQLNEALAEYTSAMRRAPNLAEAHLALGALLTKTEKWEAAESELRQAI